jgi:Fe-S cluster assembly protein SufD
MNIEDLASVAEKLNGNPRTPFFEKELSLFRQKGLSELELDSYKFTNLETFFSNLNLAEAKKEITLTKQASFPAITVVDGKIQALPTLPEGVTVKLCDLDPDLLKVLQQKNPLSHLQHALISKILLIDVSKDTEILLPLHIQHQISSSPLIGFTTIIRLGNHSRLSVIEEISALSTQGHAFISETFLEAHDGSRLEHLSLAQENSEGLAHSSIYSEIGKDASVTSFILSATGKMNRNNLEMNLNRAGGAAQSYVLYLTSMAEHSDINTVIHHKEADTTSDQLAKGILSGDSKGIFTGKIHIHPKAQRVSSGQLNKNLLLSKKAQAHSQPQLEIFADDVKCSHGSTTGQLSEEELFYFKARGIPEEKARSLLAHGFALEIVQKISNHKLRDYVDTIIKQKLAEKFSLGVV